ncbi:hypothetical protein H632_c5540p0, partial [Helicosporidium sp. ATCC 50920]
SSPGSSPAAPPTPINPFEPFTITVDGQYMGEATFNAVPVIVSTDSARRRLLQNNPIVAEFLNPRFYPWTGEPYVTFVFDIRVISIYVEWRLVGFSIPEFVDQISASGGGQMFTATTTPGPLPAGLPPSPPMPSFPPPSPDSPAGVPESPASESPESPDAQPSSPLSPPDAPGSPTTES